MELKTCNTFATDPTFPGCCGTCHWDAEEFGYGLSGDGESYDVCCKVYLWLESKGIDIYE